MKRDGLLLVSNPNLFLSPLPRAKGPFLPISCARHLFLNLSVGIPVHMLFLAVDMAVFIDKIDSH
jgi:hypothetical protein